MPFLPKSRVDCFIGVCFFVAILGVGGGIFLSEFDLPNYGTNNLQGILWGAAGLGLFFGTPTMIVTGILKARRNGFTYKTLRTPILGFILCFCFAFSSWYYGRFCEQALINIRESSQVLTKPPKFFEGIDPETYSDLSKYAAAYRYLYIGEVLEYVTSNGDTKLYEPTDEDIKSHKIMKAAQAFLASTIQVMQGLMYFWVTCGLLSTLLGLYWPIRKQKEKSI